MQLVGTWTDIEANLKMLDEYRHSRYEEDREFYEDLIKRGRCFVIHRQGEKLLFGPSRFVGYVSNNRRLHLANEHKDGKETNPAINEALGYPPKQDNVLEQEYNRLCRDLDVIPYKVTRKFWLSNT